MLIYFKVKLTGDLHSVIHEYLRNKQCEAPQQGSNAINICRKKKLLQNLNRLSVLTFSEPFKGHLFSDILFDVSLLTRYI